MNGAEATTDANVNVNEERERAGATAEELALRLLAAWDRRDLDAYVGLLADDVEWYDPAMPEPPARGRQAVRAFSENVLRAFPDFRYEIQHPICSAADGSRCAIVWRITGTNREPLLPLGYAPTGRSVSMEGVDVLDVRDGKITRILTAFDPVVAAEQLLNRPLRPTPGSWRAWAAVAAQRFLAYLART